MIEESVKNFIKIIKKTEDIIIDSVIFNKYYKVKYKEKYFDGGGYVWCNRRLSITEEEISPYLLDDKILTIIKKFLEINRDIKNIDIYSVIKAGTSIGEYYLVKYQKRYFDGGGYRWTDVQECIIFVKSIEKYLRNEKIEKIKSHS